MKLVIKFNLHILNWAKLSESGNNTFFFTPRVEIKISGKSFILRFRISKQNHHSSHLVNIQKPIDRRPNWAKFAREKANIKNSKQQFVIIWAVPVICWLLQKNKQNILRRIRENGVRHIDTKNKLSIKPLDVDFWPVTMTTTMTMMMMIINLNVT